MIRIRWSPQALQDIEGVAAYVSVDSPRYAGLVVARIVKSIERLSSFPASGRVVQERNDPRIREIIVAPYRVVYRLGPDVVVQFAISSKTSSTRA